MRTSPLLLIALLLAAPAAAQNNQQDKDFGDRAENVVSQPLRDVGAMRDKPPEILVRVQKAPYSLAGLKNCADYLREIRELDKVLGPDVDQRDEEGRPTAGNLAEAGASALVNSPIPLRGLVREATGAAAAERRLRAMVAAGVARRGFLKGYAKARNCRV